MRIVPVAGGRFYHPESNRTFDTLNEAIEAVVTHDRERYAGLIEAVRLYGDWARRSGDYPHDEEGCIAHDAIINAELVYRVEKA